MYTSMFLQYKERNFQMKEMEERQIKNKYLHAAVIKLKSILKKIDIDVDIPRESYLDFFKWIAKKTIWAAVLLLFSVLTIMGCLDLLLQYVNGVTTTKIDVNKDRNVSFPSSTVCLPMYAIDFYKLDENLKIENRRQYLHSKISKYFANHNHDKKRFLNGSFWSPAMLFVVYNFVSNLHFVENFEWTTDTKSNFPKYKMSLQKKDWWKAGRKLEKEINRLNISISELTEAVGQAIALKFNLGVTYYTTYDGHMNSSYYDYKTSFVGLSWICYNVDFSGLVITSQDETIVVEVDATSLEIALDRTLLEDEQCVILFAPSADFHMDLKILVGDNLEDFYRPSIVTDGDRLRTNYYLGAIAYDSYISYNPIQMYRFMPIINGRQQCSGLRSTEVCRSKCRASVIKNLCNCTATSLTTPENMSSECTLTTYGNCSIYDANNQLICDCLKPCTRWDYELKGLSYYYSASFYSGSIIIRLAKLDYRIFEQTYLWKTEGFIGAFGGALSLWLGIDFLMAINFFTVVVAKLIKMIIKSKQPSSSSAVLNHGQICLNKQDDTQTANQAVVKKQIGKRTADEELLTIKAFKPSNWNCLRVLSLIVTLIFFLATFLMCVRLFQKYFSNPLIIEMSTAYDKAFELPKSTEIILPMDSIYLEKNVDKTLYGENVEEYFEQLKMNKDAFLSSTAAWPPEIFALCFKYLAYLSAVEGTDLDYREMMNFSDLSRSIYRPFFWSYYSEELYDASYQLEKRLSEMEITIKELKLSVAERLKTAFQLSVKYVYAVGGVVTKENVSIIENTCIKEFRVCFKADFSNKPIRHLADYIEVSSIRNHSIFPIDNTNIYPRKIRETVGRLFLRHSPRETVSDLMRKSEITRSVINIRSKVIVSFDGQIMRDIPYWDDGFTIMEGIYGVSTTYQVFTIDAYRKIPSVKGETTCINYEKKDQCRWQCRSEMIYKKCNCTTMSLPLPYLPLGPECSFSIYNTCLQYTKQDDMQCINQCLKPCEKWKYEVDMEKQIHLDRNEAIIQIRVKKFDYAMYTEKSPWTFEKFVGAVGGVLGLWLGLDFVIVIGAVSKILGYILPRLPQALRLKKVNAGANMPDRIESNEASKKHQEETKELYSTSVIMTWSKKSFKMVIKALYSMKLVDILKLIVFKTTSSFLVLLFCFLTFNMCFLSTKQFMKNPTTMNMQILLNNTFIMPTSTLCVPVSVYNYYSTNDFGENTNYKSMRKYFAQYLENKEAFLNANDKKWPLDVYLIIFRYLSIFGKAEGFIWDSSYSCPVELKPSSDCLTYFPLSENEWKALFKLETILMRMNVSRSELLRSFGQQTLMIYDISILHITEEGDKLNQSQIEIRETLSVEFDSGVCFKINFSGAAIRSETELFNISIDSNGLHNIYISNPVLFDMHGHHKPDIKIYENMFALFGLIRTYNIGAKEFDKIFPRKKEDSDCNEYVPPDICRCECRAALIKRLCNCTAASLPIREVPSLSDDCTLAAYKNCFKFNANDDFECRKNCLRSCRRETYQWKIDNNYESGNDNQAILILRVEEFGYAIFEEEYEWTFEEFLGEFGGNLGLWMGLDIKMVSGEIFSLVFATGKHFMALIGTKMAENGVIVI